MDRLESVIKSKLERQKSKIDYQAKSQELDRRQSELEAKLREIETRDKQAQEILSWRDRFKQSPATALREIGHDPVDTFRTLANEGTPEAQLEARLADLQQKIEAQAAQLRAREEAEQAQAREHAARSVQAGFDHIYQLPDSGTARVLWDRDEYEVIARKEADKYIKETGKPICPWADVAARVEAEAKRRLSRLNPPDPAPVSVKDRPAAKTLSSQVTGRQASPKPIDKMNDEEIKEYLKHAARAAKK